VRCKLPSAQRLLERAEQDHPLVIRRTATSSRRCTGRGAAGSIGNEVGIYILGAENNDTDEIDQHVLAHEYQHFLEDAIKPDRPRSEARTRSVSASTCRVAFSEAFATAYSAMVLDEPAVSRFASVRPRAPISIQYRNRCFQRAGLVLGGVRSKCIVWEPVSMRAQRPQRIRMASRSATARCSTCSAPNCATTRR